MSCKSSPPIWPSTKNAGVSWSILTILPHSYLHANPTSKITAYSVNWGSLLRNAFPHIHQKLQSLQQYTPNHTAHFKLLLLKLTLFYQEFAHTVLWAYLKQTKVTSKYTTQSFKAQMAPWPARAHSAPSTASQTHNCVPTPEQCGLGVRVGRTRR